MADKIGLQKADNLAATAKDFYMFLSWDFSVLPLLFFFFFFVFTVVVLLTVNIIKKRGGDCCSILANLKVASGLEKLSAMDIEVLAVTAWSLWNNRNVVHHGDPGKRAATIVPEASPHMEEYFLVQAPSPLSQYIIHLLEPSTTEYLQSRHRWSCIRTTGEGTFWHWCGDSLPTSRNCNSVAHLFSWICWCNFRLYKLGGGYSTYCCLSSRVWCTQFGFCTCLMKSVNFLIKKKSCFWIRKQGKVK